MRERALLLAGFGFAIAVLLAFPALVISGVGHGWSAPIAASLWAIPVLPLLGVSWTYRHEARGRALAIAVVAAAVALDLLVVFLTRGEVVKFRAVLHESPSWVAAWAAAWFVWQVLAVVHLLNFRRIEEGPPLP